MRAIWALTAAFYTDHSIYSHLTLCSQTQKDTELQLKATRCYRLSIQLMCRGPAQQLTAVHLLTFTTRSIDVRIRQLQIQSPAIQPEPDATNQGSKDQLYEFSLPRNVKLVGRRTADQKANAAPQLPRIYPKRQTPCVLHGQGKIPCRQHSMCSLQLQRRSDAVMLLPTSAYQCTN